MVLLQLELQVVPRLEMRFLEEDARRDLLVLLLDLGWKSVTLGSAVGTGFWRLSQFFSSGSTHGVFGVWLSDPKFPFEELFLLK